MARADDTYDRASFIPLARNNRTGDVGLSWPKAVLDTWDSVTLPRDVSLDKVDHRSREGFKRTLGLAGTMTGGVRAFRTPDGALTAGIKRPNRPFHKWRNTPEEVLKEKTNKTLDTGLTTKGFREDDGLFDIPKGDERFDLTHIIGQRNAQGIDGEEFVRERLANVLSKERLNGFENRKQFGKNTRSAIVNNSDSEGIIGLDFLGKPRKRIKSAYPRKKVPR